MPPAWQAKGNNKEEEVRSPQNLVIRFHVILGDYGKPRSQGATHSAKAKTASLGDEEVEKEERSGDKTQGITF